MHSHGSRGSGARGCSSGNLGRSEEIGQLTQHFSLQLRQRITAFNYVDHRRTKVDSLRQQRRHGHDSAVSSISRPGPVRVRNTAHNYLVGVLVDLKNVVVQPNSIAELSGKRLAHPVRTALYPPLLSPALEGVEKSDPSSRANVSPLPGPGSAYGVGGPQV